MRKPTRREIAAIGRNMRRMLRQEKQAAELERALERTELPASHRRAAKLVFAALTRNDVILAGYAHEVAMKAQPEPRKRRRRRRARP